MGKDEALRLALEALENAEYGDYDKKELDQAITAIKAALEAKDAPVVWNEGVPAMLPKQKEGETFIVSYEPKLEAKDEPVAHSVVAGALFDFMGWLTSREKRLILSSVNEASPAVEAITEFAMKRNLSLKYAEVGYWTKFLSTPPQRKPLTDDEITLIIADCASSHQHTDIHFARAIEAAHGIKGEA